MYSFFFNLYLSLFTGTWSTNTPNTLGSYLNAVAQFIVNALGGDFAEKQEYYFLPSNLSPFALFANILALITMFMVCLTVFKLVKMVFSIFFGGR